MTQDKEFKFVYICETGAVPQESCWHSLSVPADINVYLRLRILLTKEQPVCNIWSKLPFF